MNTTFEKPETSAGEYVDPGDKQVFLKQRDVIVVGENDSVTCENDLLEMSVVVQTVHGDIEQDFTAHLSGGYHVEDSGSIQHPCKNVTIDQAEEGETDG